MRRRRRRSPSDDEGVDGLEPADVLDLQARFAEVDADHAGRRDARLVRRLKALVDRRVPVRGVEPVWSLQGSRLRFADGTAVVVRGDVAGDVGVLAMWARSASVVATSCALAADGVHIVFDLPRGRRHVSVLVTGLDQPT